MSKRPLEVALNEDVEKRRREDPDQEWQDGEGGERAPGASLTADNVVRVLQQVREPAYLWGESLPHTQWDFVLQQVREQVREPAYLWGKSLQTQWEFVGQRILGISEYQLDKLTINCATDEKRLQSMVTFWLLKCSYASWRYLIWRLEYWDQHDVANQIYDFAEPLTDPTLNVETLMPLLGSLSVAKLVHVPSHVDLLREIEQQNIKSEGERRQVLLQWYLRYSPFADLAEIAGRLHYWEETSALKKVKEHLKRAPESTLSLSNVTEVFYEVYDLDRWNVYGDYGLPYWLNIPRSKIEEIERHYYPFNVGVREALLKYYIESTPFPSWKAVAYAAYMGREYGALEKILQRYLKELNLQKMCEEAVLKCVRTEEDIDSLPLPKRIRCSMKTKSSYYMKANMI